MQLTNQHFFILFSAALLLTGAITPIMKILALRLGITDKPNQSHKTHVNPVPYLGGLAIVIGIFGTAFFATLLLDFTQQTALLASSILVPALLMALVGLLDDMMQLGPLPRFAAQNFLGLFVALVLINTNTLGSPLGIAVVDFLVTMLWLVGIPNSINFFDNIDGGAAGSTTISSLALALIAISTGQDLIGAMALVMAGSTAGFLFWNRPPARIYMGDAGSMFLGVLIASLTVRLDSEMELGKMGLAIPCLLLAIPILDTSVAVIKRIKRGVSIFQGGQDHLSHRLIRLGLKKRTVVIVLWIGSGIFSTIAVFLALGNYGDSRIVTVLALVLWLSIFTFFAFTRDQD